MARECVRLTVEEKDFLVAMGWVVHGGPYTNSDDCVAACFSPPPPPPIPPSPPPVTVPCCAETIPYTLIGDFTSLASFNGSGYGPVTDFGVTMPQTINMTFGTWDGHANSWGAIVDGTPPTRYQIYMYCNGATIGSPFNVVFNAYDGGAIYGSSNGGAVAACTPFSLDVNTNVSGVPVIYTIHE